MPDQAPRPSPLDGILDVSKPSQPKVDWAAMALAAMQSGSLSTVPTTAQQPHFSVKTIAPQEQTWGQWGVNQAGRIVGGIGGGLVGSLGGPIGTLAGIATGAAIGDDWAQGREVEQGVRDQRNPWETLAAGVTAPIPGGTIARGTRLMPAIGKALLTAQPANLASSLAMQGAEGNGISAGRTVRDMAGSTALGTGIGLGLRGAQRTATRVAQAPAVQHLLADETGAIGPLKKDLQGAKPRYNIGALSYQPTFASPVDMAAYIVTQKTPSKRDADYLAYAMQETGLDEAGVKALGQQVRSAVKATAMTQQGGNSAKPAAITVSQVWQEDGSVRAPGPTRVAPRKAPALKPIDDPNSDEYLPDVPDPEYGVQEGPDPWAQVSEIPGIQELTLTGATGRTPKLPIRPKAAAEPRAVEAAKPVQGLPLDLENMPASVPGFGTLTPGQLKEDVARTFKRNVETLGFSEQSAREMAELTASPEAQVQKRRVMPIDLIKARAAEIEPTLQARGVALNAEQGYALATHLAGLEVKVRKIGELAGDLDDLETRVVKNDPDAVARMNEISSELGVSGVPGIRRAKLEAAHEMAMFAMADEAAGSEWGRSGRMRQEFAKARKLDDVAFLKRAYEMGAPKDEALDAVARLAGDPLAQRQYLIDLYKPSGQDFWKAYLSQNMLSGPPTLGVNLLSNAVSYVRHEAGQMQAAGMDRATHKGTRVLMLPPTKLLAQSYADGARHAGKAFVSAMKYGFTDLDAADTVYGGREVFRGSWLARAMEKSGVDAELSKQLGRGAANGIKRMMLATDAAVQMMGIYPEAYRRATAESWNEGLRGADLADGILRRVKGLDLSSDVAKPIREYAKDITFSREMGESAALAQRALNSIDNWTLKGTDKLWAIRSGMDPKEFPSGSKYKLAQYPLGYAHIPFLRIAVNLWKQTVQTAVTNPVVGPFNLAAQHGDRAKNLQRTAQATQFYAVAATIAALYEAGAIDFTTRAPENEFERTQWYREGKQPWAIGIRGRYLPLTSLGSVGMALAPLGVYLRGVSKPDDDKTKSERAAEAMAAIAKVELDATVVRSVMGLFEGLTDENKQGRLAGNYIAQLTPHGALGRFGRDLVDPSLRDPDGVGDEIKAQLPFASKTVAPRLDNYGEPIQRQPVGKRVTGSTKLHDDYVSDELIKLKEALPDVGREAEGIYPSALKAAATTFEKTIESRANKGITRPEDAVKVRLTDEERQQYMRLVGTMVHEALADVIAPDNAEWTALSPQEKRETVKQLKKIGKEVGEELFLEEWLGTP